jgi:hypothetical protein
VGRECVTQSFCQLVDTQDSERRKKKRKKKKKKKIAQLLEL